MDVSSLLTPQTITIIIFILSLAILQSYSDIKEVRLARRISRLSAAYVKKNNTPRISVLIDLTRSADTIFPLLDHLYSHNYANLEVIVVIKHTAGKYAQKKLTSYRRSTRHKLLKLVKHSKGMTRETVLHRNASGELIMLLSADDTLSSNFFTNIALDALDHKADVIIPAQHSIISTSLMSAMRTTQSVWRYVFIRLKTTHTVKGLRNGYVYRRRILINQSSIQEEYDGTTAQHAAIIAVSSGITGRQSSRQSIKRTFSFTKKEALLLLAAALALVTISFLSDYNFELLAQLILIGYVVVFTVSTFTIKEYSVAEKITLAMFAPFSILIIAIISIRSFLNNISTVVTGSTSALKQRLLLTK